ncbi:hypothetical protein DENSPDRAFT_192297 [Dentipellis sp. KUC8613]|nr:hypothetical protein DENSPDRAFT_192297 [Dentipellis sp. KUC8613]
MISDAHIHLHLRLYCPRVRKYVMLVAPSPSLRPRTYAVDICRPDNDITTRTQRQQHRHQARSSVCTWCVRTRRRPLACSWQLATGDSERQRKVSKEEREFWNVTVRVQVRRTPANSFSSSFFSFCPSTTGSATWCTDVRSISRFGYTLSDPAARQPPDSRY